MTESVTIDMILDILDTVLDHILRDKPSLSKASLVSKSWRAVAFTKTLHTMSFSDNGGTFVHVLLHTKWYNGLGPERLREMAACVKELHLRGRIAADPLDGTHVDLHTLYTIRHAFPRLYSLLIVNCVWSSMVSSLSVRGGATVIGGAVRHVGNHFELARNRPHLLWSNGAVWLDQDDLMIRQPDDEHIVRLGQGLWSVQGNVMHEVVIAGDLTHLAIDGLSPRTDHDDTTEIFGLLNPGTRRTLKLRGWRSQPDRVNIPLSVESFSWVLLPVSMELNVTDVQRLEVIEVTDMTAAPLHDQLQRNALVLRHLHIALSKRGVSEWS